MKGFLIRPQFQHGAQYGNTVRLVFGSRLPTQKTIKTGLHGIGIGIERIVDQREFRLRLAHGGHGHAVGADAGDVRKPVRHVIDRHAQPHGDACRGERVHDVVLAANAERDVGALISAAQRKGGTVQLVAPHVSRGDERRIGIRKTEPHDIARGDATHCRHMLIVRVQYGGPARNQTLYDLRLCLRDPFGGSEFSQMSHAHLEHDCQIRRYQSGQIGDFTNMVRTHLRHQETCLLIHLQRGQRQSDLIVERSDRGDGRSQLGQQRLHQILGGGFAYGSGNAYDGERFGCRTSAFYVVLGELTQRLHRVGDHYLRDLRIGDLMINYRADRSLRSDLRHEIMTIHAFSGNGHEHRAVNQLT